jgi:hypothetical protein
MSRPPHRSDFRGGDRIRGRRIRPRRPCHSRSPPEEFRKASYPWGVARSVLLRAVLYAALAVGALAAVRPAESAGPALADAPTMVGTAAAGKQLTGLAGNWAGFGPIGYRFQWYRCNAAGGGCRTIHGATGQTYPLGLKDIGKTVGLSVRATDSSGTATAYSSLIGPIAPKRPLLETTAQPVVTGAPVEGKTLAVTLGTWSPTPAKFSYQWERCNANGRICAPIPGATRSSYVVQGSDLGHALLAIVQGTNGVTIQKAFSTASPAVVDGSVIGPKLTIGPSISGLAAVADKLSVATGIWKGVGPLGLSFQWYRCNATGGHCLSIHGSTSPTYRLVPKDTGQTIGLTEYASDSTGTTTAYASLVGPIAPRDAALEPVTQPTIAGTARVGGALTIDPGTWSSSGTSYAYAWLLCNPNGRLCAPVTGATSISYRPSPEDAGHTLVGQVTATAGGTSQAALTPATSVLT